MAYRSNLVGKVPPTATDDVNKGYRIGSRWTDKAHNRKYTCTDATNRAAIWIEDMADVTDQVRVGDAGAVMDSDFVKEDGFMRKTGEGTYEAIKSNMGASAAPTTSDDSNSGYAIGSRWFDTTSGEEYVCFDATAGAAVWIETTASYSDAEAVAAIAAVNVYLKKDGSEILTSDWDIGNGRKILADEIRARDGDGLKLYDDGGNGIFVKDGGDVGIGTATPGERLEVVDSDDITTMKIMNSNDTNVHAKLGVVKTGASYYAAIWFGQATPTTSNFSFLGGATYTLFNSPGGYIAFRIAGANKMKLFPSGGLAIGDSFYSTDPGTDNVSIEKNLGIRVTVPTLPLDIDAGLFRLRDPYTPASSGAAGHQGSIGWDADYLYICVAANTWERTPHAWDINVYDDAAVAKLAGIEAAADVTDTTNVAAAGGVMALTAHFDKDDLNIGSSIEFGSLPAYSYIIRTQVHVTELFNASGTDVVEIGYTGDVNAFGLSTNIETTGIKNPTAGVAIGYNATARTASLRPRAGITTDATTGKATIILEYIVVGAP